MEQENGVLRPGTSQEGNQEDQTYNNSAGIHLNLFGLFEDGVKLLDKTVQVVTGFVIKGFEAYIFIFDLLKEVRSKNHPGVIIINEIFGVLHGNPFPHLYHVFFKINGGKQSKTIWNKYKNIYEDRVGFPLNKNSKIVIETTAEESMNHFKTI